MWMRSAPSGLETVWENLYATLWEELPARYRWCSCLQELDTVQTGLVHLPSQHPVRPPPASGCLASPVCCRRALPASTMTQAHLH